jgi:hypothetical protein
MTRFVCSILLALATWLYAGAERLTVSGSTVPPLLWSSWLDTRSEIIKKGFAEAAQGPTLPAAAFVYSLHIAKPPHAISYLIRTPDNAVLVFAPHSNGRWSLIRLTLGSASPREEQLAIMGLTPDQLRGDEAKGRGDVNVSPDGHYAVARTQTWKIERYPTVGVRATVAIIDLQNWKILSERSTTDPMYAGSDWAFNKDGVLITESNPTSSGRPGHLDQAFSTTHKAVSLLLPDLQPSLTCNYTVVLGDASHSRGSAPREKSIVDISGSCAELVNLAEASSVEDIYHPGRALDRLHRVAEQLHFAPEEFAATPHTNSFNGCRIEDLGVGDRFALYVCTRSHQTWYDTVKYTALSLSVVSVADGKEILRVPRSVKNNPTAILVTTSGEDDLMILEDGVNLVVYRLRART